MTGKKKFITPLALLGVAAGVAYWHFQGQSRTDTNLIRVSGNIEVTGAEVSFKIAGRVEERLIAEGKTIKVGQVVARLDSRELAQEVALRRAEVWAARAALAELEAGSRPEEIAQAEAVLERVKAEASRLQIEYARQKKLYDGKVIPIREYEVAQMDDDVARAKVREAKERLTLLRKGPREETIEQARARLEQAK